MVEVNYTKILSNISLQCMKIMKALLSHVFASLCPRQASRRQRLSSGCELAKNAHRPSR